jgi:hypothetical protein
MNNRQAILDSIREKINCYVIGTSLALIATTIYAYGDNHHRIVLNIFEIFISVAGILVSVASIYYSSQIYYDLQERLNGQAKEVFYKFCFACLGLVSSTYFLFLLVQWLTKASYNLVGAEVGQQFSLFEYFSQQIIIMLLIDNQMDLYHIQITVTSRPLYGEIAVTDGYMTPEKVMMVEKHQHIIQKRELEKYLKLRKAQYMERKRKKKKCAGGQK